MRATYANCFGPVEGLLLTEEPSVAAANADALIVDRLIDPVIAEAVNKWAWDLAFGWAVIGGPDVTSVEGISAADLGGLEAAIGVLIPAARGVLGVLAAIDMGIELECLTATVPATSHRVYVRTESMQAAGAMAAARARFGAQLPISSRTEADPRNAILEAKYVRVRDVDPIRETDPRLPRILRTAAFLGTDLLGAARRKSRSGTILVYEYNPTRAFADAYGSRRTREWRQLRHCPPRSVLGSIAREGDRCSPPLPRSNRRPREAFTRRLADTCDERHEELQAAFTVAGVSLWPHVRPALIEIAGRYAAFSEAAVPIAARRFKRYGVDAVLVPFDTPPEARTLVRVAQRAGLPTFVINDGWKGDDHTVEGMTADTALSWSASIASRYFARRTHGSTVVTGNPKSEGIERRTLQRPSGRIRRVLIGSFTFSPSDINCRRSDSERFLSDILEAISGLGRGAVEVVTVKLHPADTPDHYAEILGSYVEIPVTVVSTGDVVELFDSHDIYVTTYSSSLLEAAHVGLPFVYYRVNQQRFHPPFADDAVLTSRTAETPSALTQLMMNPATCEPIPNADEWLALYLGANDGRAVDRIVAAIAADLA